jgi:hypothetical protein
MAGFLRRLLEFFTGPSDATRVARLSDEELMRAALYFRRAVHDLPKMAKRINAWKRIRKVRCPVEFDGSKYVEGRNEGFVVDRRLTVVPGDAGMEYTTACVLVDRIPYLLLESRVRLVAMLIEADSGFQPSKVMGLDGRFCDSWDEFSRLPARAQDILRAIFTCAWQAREENTIAREKMIDYEANR